MPGGKKFSKHSLTPTVLVELDDSGRNIEFNQNSRCQWMFTIHVLLPWPKKRTIIEIRGEKNAVPRVISCSIRRDQRRAKVADSRGSDLPCADRAWSSMISHVEQRSSRRESRWWFFFLARVVERCLIYSDLKECQNRRCLLNHWQTFPDQWRSVVIEDILQTDLIS